MNDLQKAALTVIDILDEATGYEVMLVLKNSSVDVSHQQIYRALDILESQGYVKSSTHVNPGKPDRRVYSVVDLKDAPTYLYKREDYALGLGCVASISAQAKSAISKYENFCKVRKILPSQVKQFIKENEIARREALIQASMFYQRNPTIVRERVRNFMAVRNGEVWALEETC